jgi:hypothetical protein
VTGTRFDGARCEHCKALLEFKQPPGVTISSGEQVDVFHPAPWCRHWQHPLRRESCIPRAILDECQKEGSS